VCASGQERLMVFFLKRLCGIFHLTRRCPGDVLPISELVLAAWKHDDCEYLLEELVPYVYAIDNCLAYRIHDE